MSKLDDFNNNLKAARELFEQAQHERNEYIVELVKDGKAEEIIESEWRERYDVGGNLRVYCAHCMAYARTPIKSRRCPYCGAHMSNGSDLPKFATPENYVPPEGAYDNPLYIEPAPVEEAPAKSTVPPLDLNLIRIRYAVKNLAARTNSKRSEVAKLFGMSDQQLSQYMLKDIKPRKATIEKISKLYQDLTGEFLPSRRSEIEAFLEAAG